MIYQDGERKEEGKEDQIRPFSLYRTAERGGAATLFRSPEKKEKLVSSTEGGKGKKREEWAGEPLLPV